MVYDGGITINESSVRKFFGCKLFENSLLQADGNAFEMPIP
jgi:hypothetical protein